MDIIATGVTQASSQRVKQIIEYIRKVHTDFRARIDQQGVKYANMFDFLNSKAKEGLIGDQNELKESEFRDALMQLEEDNVISLIGHKRHPTIRFIAE